LQDNLQDVIESLILLVDMEEEIISNFKTIIAIL